jgi:NAD(P)H-hydrate epimerase
MVVGRLAAHSMVSLRSRRRSLGASVEKPVPRPDPSALGRSADGRRSRSRRSVRCVTVSEDEVWWLTADQMREVDRLTIDRFGVDLTRMMENAGHSLAELAISLARPSSVVVLAGGGGNGGGGLVAARHLANRGVAVEVVLASPDQMTPVPAAQLAILTRMGVAVVDEPQAAGAIIDALVGYSLRGRPEGRVAELVSWANAAEGTTISLDVPTGLDATTGRAEGVCVRADATLTLAMPKAGLRTAPEVGDLFLADISVPPEVYLELGFPRRASPFGSSSTVQVTARS